MMDEYAAVKEATRKTNIKLHVKELPDVEGKFWVEDHPYDVDNYNAGKFRVKVFYEVDGVKVSRIETGSDWICNSHQLKKVCKRLVADMYQEKLRLAVKTGTVELNKEEGVSFERAKVGRGTVSTL